MLEFDVLLIDPMESGLAVEFIAALMEGVLVFVVTFDVLSRFPAGVTPSDPVACDWSDLVVVLERVEEPVKSGFAVIPELIWLEPVTEAESLESELPEEVSTVVESDWFVTLLVSDDVITTVVV